MANDLVPDLTVSPTRPLRLGDVGDVQTETAYFYPELLQASASDRLKSVVADPPARTFPRSIQETSKVIHEARCCNSFDRSSTVTGGGSDGAGEVFHSPCCRPACRVGGSSANAGEGVAAARRRREDEPRRMGHGQAGFVRRAAGRCGCPRVRPSPHDDDTTLNPPVFQPCPNHQA
jgi:hypothetical protein